MNMLNRNYKTSFVKPQSLKKAQSANPHLYDIGCYNDNLALILAPESDKTIRLAQETEQKYFSDNLRMTYTPEKNVYSKEVFKKQTILLDKRMDETLPWSQKCKSSEKFEYIKQDVQSFQNGLIRCFKIINDTRWNILVSPEMKIVIEEKLNPTANRLTNDVDEFYQTLKEEMVADLKYFKSLENEVESLQSQLELQQT
ncbi:hypothetical protein Tco_0921972 [Tanacetum coccineum]|uniref:Uncharacterized protein n=1 Tax=Tanacetum coccineum TaxID=301880 RepID=A0ABQ5CXV8_9ASTR